MMTSTTSKALTITELIKSGKDEMAAQLMGDVTDLLDPDEIDAILLAVYMRGEEGDPIHIQVDFGPLREFGLPMIVCDELDSMSDSCEFIDQALKSCRLDDEVDLKRPMKLAELEVVCSGWALYWPYRDAQDFQFVFDTYVSVGDNSSIEVTDDGVVIRKAVLCTGYTMNQAVEEYAAYECDLLIRKNGRIERRGTPVSLT